MIGEKTDRWSHSMAEGKPAARIFCFALPLMLGNIFQQVYTLTDTAVVGQVLGMKALAALGATEWLTFLMFGTVSGLTAGFGVTFAHAYGGRDDQRLIQAVFHAVLLSVLSAIMLAAAALAGIGVLLRLMGTPEEIRAEAAVYLRILYGGIPITFAYQLAASILRALGDSRTPFAAIALSSLCNILLDIGLVAYGKAGIAGAAAATVLAQLLSAVWCIRGIMKYPQFADIIREQRCKAGGLQGRLSRISDRRHRIDVGLVKEQLSLGLPMALQNAVTAVGGLFVQTVVNRFGFIFAAGFTAANRLYGLLETAASSYGQAMATFAGQNVGAKCWKRLKAGMRAAVLMGSLTAVLMSAVMILGGRDILQWFLSGERAETGQALDIGQQFLNVLAAFFPLLYLLYILRAGIQGLGNGIIPMLSSWVQLLMRAGCAGLLTVWIGYKGVFWGEVLAWLGADLLLGTAWVWLNKKSRITC